LYAENSQLKVIDEGWKTKAGGWRIGSVSLPVKRELYTFPSRFSNFVIFGMGCLQSDDKADSISHCGDLMVFGHEAYSPTSG
jgi:hypothetical protein